MSDAWLFKKIDFLSLHPNIEQEEFSFLSPTSHMPEVDAMTLNYISLLGVNVNYLESICTVQARAVEMAF